MKLIKYRHTLHSSDRDDDPQTRRGKCPPVTDHFVDKPQHNFKNEFETNKYKLVNLHYNISTLRGMIFHPWIMISRPGFMFFHRRGVVFVHEALFRKPLEDI